MGATIHRVHGLPASEGTRRRDVERFLTHLALQRRVSASTQNQALAALLFFYREVLQSKLPWLDSIVRAKRPQHLPIVLSPEDVWRIFDMAT
jgi:site-specific recombinase XerD